MRKYLAIVMAAVLLVAAALFFATTGKPSEDNVAAYRQGVGTYGPIPQTLSAVPGSVEQSLSFISERSSVTFSKTFAKRLSALEAGSLSASKLKLDQIATAISNQLLETISSLSDPEIDEMGQTWRTVPNFVHPERRPFVDLRRDGRGVPIALWGQVAREFRDGQTQQAQQWQANLPAQVLEELQTRADNYAAASSAWNTGRYSPLQAILLAYSLISDDYLDGDLTYLASGMQASSTFMQSQFGIVAPITGRKAYGLNGYMISTPTNYLFTEQVANRILDRYQEAL